MADSGTYDDATLARRAKIAEAMYSNAVKPRKIEHWAQGLAQLGEAGIGGLSLRGIDDQQRESEAALAATYAKLIGGGSAPAPQQTPTGGAAMVAPPMGAKVAAAMSAPGRIYSNDEASPLDPPSGADRDKIIRTIVAEAGNQPQVGQQAVASVIRNRAVNGGYGGDTPTGVVTAPSQFEPWNTQGGRQRMASIDPNSLPYQNAGKALDQAYTGDDPTGGALNFVAPKAQAALGRPMPEWAQGPGQDIGDHRFFGGNPVAQAMTPPAPAAPAQPDAKAQIAGLLSSQNPAERKLGMQLAQNVLSQQFKADQPTDEMREYNLDSAQRKARGEQPLSFFDFKSGIKKAGATNVTTNVDNKAESEFDKAAAKQQADRFNELASEGPQARQMVSDVQTLTQLGNQIGTGKGAEFKAKLGPYADALGVKVDGLSDIQAFEAVVNRVAPNLRVKGSGAQSDFELKNFLKSIPSLGNTAEGNALVGKTLEGLAQNKVRAAEIGSKALNKEITRSEAEKMLRELPDPMAEWREATRSQPARAAAPTRQDIEAEMRRRRLIP